MPISSSQDSQAKLLRKAEELEASLPIEVRVKLAELRKQSDEMPRPTDLRRETLRSIKDQDLDFALSWYVTERVRVSGKGIQEVLSQEPPPVGTFYLAWLLEAEVLNGGFNQYFWNVSPDLVARTPDALRQLGDTEALEILRAAMTLGEEESAMREELKAQRSLSAFSQSYKQGRLKFEVQHLTSCKVERKWASNTRT